MDGIESGRGQAGNTQRKSASLLIRLKKSDTGRFHALLESHGHTAFFSVLSVNPPLLRLFFSPDQEREVRGLLKILAKDIPLIVEEWPF